MITSASTPSHGPKPLTGAAPADGGGAHGGRKPLVVGGARGGGWGCGACRARAVLSWGTSDFATSDGWWAPPGQRVRPTLPTRVNPVMNDLTGPWIRRKVWLP